MTLTMNRLSSFPGSIQKFSLTLIYRAYALLYMELLTSCGIIATVVLVPAKKRTMGTFTELKNSCQSLGSDDPLRAILNDPWAKGGKWSVNEFLRTGQIEVNPSVRVASTEESQEWASARLWMCCGTSD